MPARHDRKGPHAMTDVTTEPVVTWTAEGPAFPERLANPPANQLGRFA
jgi:hypothetical protein